MLASNWRSLVNGSSLFSCCHMPLKSHYGVQWCARPPFVPVVRKCPVNDSSLRLF